MRICPRRAALKLRSFALDPTTMLLFSNSLVFPYGGRASYAGAINSSSESAGVKTYSTKSRARFSFSCASNAIDFQAASDARSSGFLSFPSSPEASSASNAPIDSSEVRHCISEETTPFLNSASSPNGSCVAKPRITPTSATVRS